MSCKTAQGCQSVTFGHGKCRGQGQGQRGQMLALKVDQEGIVGELRKEIDTLRAENSELKFHLYINCPEIVCRKCPPKHPKEEPQPTNCKGKVVKCDVSTNTNHAQLPELCRNSLNEDNSDFDPRSVGLLRSEIGRLEVELEGARKTVAELQLHQENNAQLLQNQLDRFQREILELKSSGLEIFQLQIPLEGRREWLCGSGRRRRPSLESILPHDYKESVATLPPIQLTGPPPTGPSAPSGLDMSKYPHLAKLRSIGNIGVGPCSKVKLRPGVPRFHHPSIPGALEATNISNISNISSTTNKTQVKGSSLI